MEHEMKLLEEPYKKVASGKKTIEIRLFDEKRQKLNIGDIIQFSKLPDLKEKLSVEIIGLLRYKTFNDLITDFDMEFYGYEKEYSKEKFLEEIYSIYSKEQEQQYGVLGIKIKLLNTNKTIQSPNTL